MAGVMIIWISNLKTSISYLWWYSGLIQGLRPANERRRYFVMTSLIGWAQPRISPDNGEHVDDGDYDDGYDLMI